MACDQRTRLLLLSPMHTYTLRTKGYLRHPYKELSASPAYVGKMVDLPANLLTRH
jgi:hypothetical protein